MLGRRPRPRQKERLPQRPGHRPRADRPHNRMMGAPQPLPSRANSQTVNLPEDATVDDIINTYVEGWKLGLKAIAIYRDGSKRSAPLNVKKTVGMGTQADPGIEGVEA